MSTSRYADRPASAPRALLAGGTVRRSLGVAAALSALLGGLSISGARAAGPLLLPMVAQRLAGVTSYQARMTATSSGARAASFVQTVTAVRRGGQWQLDILSATRPLGAAETTLAEYVVVGASLCSRVAFTTGPAFTPTGAFTCQRAPGQAALLAAGVLPIRDLLPAGGALSGSYTYGQPALLRGVRCDAYRYSVRTPLARESGTLYLSHATGLPCEQDATTVGQSIFGIGLSPATAGTATTTATVVWSRFDDSTLRIPATS